MGAVLGTIYNFGVDLAKTMDQLYTVLNFHITVNGSYYSLLSLLLPAGLLVYMSAQLVHWALYGT